MKYIATYTFSFLGIIFNNLNWFNPCSILSGKISKVTYIMKQLHYNYPEHILKMLYNILVQSKLIYGLLLWGVGNIDKIFMKQKEAIRAVTISQQIAHTEPLFRMLSI